MKIITIPVEVEITSVADETQAKAIAQKYRFTAEGLKFMDMEMSKSFSLVKTTLQRFLKPRKP